MDINKLNILNVYVLYYKNNFRRIDRRETLERSIRKYAPTHRSSPDQRLPSYILDINRLHITFITKTLFLVSTGDVFCRI